MALLDFLNSDSAALGLGLLAAGGPTTDPNRSGFGSRLAEGVGYAQQRKQQAMQQKLMESQMAENVAQSELQRQKLALALRQQQLDESFMGNPLLGATPGGGTAEAPGGPGPAPMGAPSAGAAPGTPQAGAGAQPVGGGFTAAGIAKQFGIPVEAVISDYRFNGGKKIAELIADRTKANWVNVNGNLVNTNAAGFQGGLQGGVSASNDGRVTQYMPDGAGGLVVGAPRGALDTYRAYQGVGNRSAADFQPETVIDEATGQKVLRPRSEVLQPQGGGAPMGGGGGAPSRPMIGPGAGGPTNTSERGMAAGVAALENPAAIAAARAREISAITRDLSNPSLGPQDRAMLSAQLQTLQGQDTRYGGPLIGPGAGGAGAGRGSMGMPAAPIASPAAAPQAGGALIARPASAGNVVELSPAQQTANKVADVTAVKRAEAGVARETASATTGRQMAQMQEAATLANKLLDEGPTGSGVGAMVDKVGAFVGQPIKGAGQAAQLKALGGWLVANVPRMEGPQSDRDVANYGVMAGQVGDETLPAATRKAALKTVISLQEKYAAINGGEAPSGRSSPAPNTLPSGWTVKVK